MLVMTDGSYLFVLLLSMHAIHVMDLEAQTYSLGGSELTRIPTMYELDHEWSDRGTIATHPPMNGMRVVVELYPATSPLASQNFYRLCPGKEASAGASGKTLHYRGSAVHRVQSGFVIQGGDFIFGNGSGGESVYGGKGGKFKDDRGGLALKHDCAGVLSMGNSGKHSISSQFFLTLAVLRSATESM